MRIDDTPGPNKTLPTLVQRDLAEAEVGSEVELTAPEVVHVRSARLRTGDGITLSDGRGTRWEAEILTIERRSVRCRLLRPRPFEPPPAVSLWIPVANRDRTLWLIEKAVELGVASIRWIDWERSRSVADGARSTAFRTRASNRAEAALKQSGGAWLPQMFEVASLEEALALEPSPGEIRWLGDARGEPAFRVAAGLSHAANPGSSTLCISVGPEGGFTEDEGRACRAAGFQAVAFGRGTLRFETAAIGILGLATAALDPAADRGDST